MLIVLLELFGIHAWPYISVWEGAKDVEWFIFGNFFIRDFGDLFSRGRSVFLEFYQHFIIYNLVDRLQDRHDQFIPSSC